MFTIYLITNSFNGKIYVGLTEKGISGRWATHLRDFKKRTKSPHLYSAFRKYGLKYFTIDTLSTCDTREDANFLEKYWIRFFGSRNPDIGYNMTEGGDGGGVFLGRKHSPETKVKMSRSATGRHLSEDVKEKIRIDHRSRTGEQSSNYNHEVSTDEIVLLYREGKTTRQIAALFKVEKTLVKGRLSSAGVTLRLNPREARTKRLISEGKQHLLNPDSKEMVRLYNEGRTTKEIAPMFEMTSLAVRQRLIKEGVTLRHGGKRTKEEWPQPQT